MLYEILSFCDNCDYDLLIGKNSLVSKVRRQYLLYKS
jgi:hypothetical protein